MADVTFIELTADTAPHRDDVVATVDVSDTTGSAEGTSKKVTLGDVTDLASWQRLTAFSSTAPSTSTITTTSDLTALVVVGSPLRFVLSAVTYYAVCTAVNATTITIAGAPLTTGAGDLTELLVGSPERFVQLDFTVPGTFADGVDATLLLNDASAPFRWHGPPANLVAISAVNVTADGTSNPAINISIGGSNASGSGVTLGAANTWADSGAVDITTGAYRVVRGDAVEVACTTAGGAGDAADLVVSAQFILE